MARSSSPKPKRKASKEKVEIIDVTVEDLAGLAERLHERKLHEGDYELILKILFAYDHVLNLLKHDRTSLNRLRRALFGSTEHLKKVLEKAKEQSEAAQKEGSGDGDPPADSAEAESSDKPSAPGHGRNGADQYRSAPEEYVEHEALKPGDQCPECGKGKLYEIEPTVMVRVSGQAPLQATIYRMQRLRCKTCGKLFHATPPAEAQGKKFDETAAAMIALRKGSHKTSGCKYHTRGPEVRRRIVGLQNTGRGCLSIAWAGWRRASGFPCQPQHSGMWYPLTFRSSNRSLKPLSGKSRHGSCSITTILRSKSWKKRA